MQSFSHHVASKQAKNTSKWLKIGPKRPSLANHGESSKFETKLFLLKPIQIQRKTIKTMQTTLLLPYFHQKVAHNVAKCWGKRPKSAFSGPFLGSIVQSSIGENYFFGFLWLQTSFLYYILLHKNSFCLPLALLRMFWCIFHSFLPVLALLGLKMLKMAYF